MIQLKLYTKDRCHLCEKMKSAIQSLKGEESFYLKEIDITSDNLLFENYKDKIPVLEINGRMFAKYTVDPLKLKKKLASLNRISQ